PGGEVPPVGGPRARTLLAGQPAAQLVDPGLQDTPGGGETRTRIVPGRVRVGPPAAVGGEPLAVPEPVATEKVEEDGLQVPLLVDPAEPFLEAPGLDPRDRQPEHVAVPDVRQVDPGARHEAVREPRPGAGRLGDAERAVACVALELDHAVAGVTE